jgi:transposase InsO family protein
MALSQSAVSFRLRHHNTSKPKAGAVTLLVCSGAFRMVNGLAEIKRVYRASGERYGARKVWRQLKREQFVVARCTTERLMAKLVLQGVCRGKRWKTTILDESAELPLDIVGREFRAQRPNPLWVADFTYVPSR